MSVVSNPREQNKDEYFHYAEDEYDDSRYYKNVGDAKVIDSTHSNPDKYESNGLQASIVHDSQGHTTVVFRGSQGMGGAAGNKDWAQDLGFNDPYAYQNPNSQVKDAEAWIKDMQAQGKLPDDAGMKNVTFTGHSLGGGLAMWAAVHYGGYAVAFSGPSTYNMLTPEERANLDKSKDRITNYVAIDDGIPHVPEGVPRLGITKYIETSDMKQGFWKYLGLDILGASGHDHAYLLVGGKIVECPNQALAEFQSDEWFSNTIIGNLGLVGFGIAELEKLGMYTGVGQGLSDGKDFLGTTLNAAGGWFKVEKDSNQPVQVLVEDSITSLKAIKKENDALVTELTDRLENNIAVANSYWGFILSPQDIDDEVKKRNLQVLSHINEDKVAEVSQKLDKEIAELQDFGKKYSKLIQDAVEVDKQGRDKMIATESHSNGLGTNATNGGMGLGGNMKPW